MVLRPELRRILQIIAEKVDNSTSTSTRDTVIIDASGLPEDEVRKYLNELASLELITLHLQATGQADEKGRKYRMLNIRKEGLQELASEQEFR